MNSARALMLSAVSLGQVDATLDISVLLTILAKWERPLMKSFAKGAARYRKASICEDAAMTPECLQDSVREAHAQRECASRLPAPRSVPSLPVNHEIAAVEQFDKECAANQEHDGHPDRHHAAPILSELDPREEEDEYQEDHEPWPRYLDHRPFHELQ
jgi:hypothetical protein